MSDLHRKIELQSMEDLQYLVANARRAAQEHLDQLFPPSSNPDLKDEDPMRGPIERNVQEVRAQSALCLLSPCSGPPSFVFLA